MHSASSSMHSASSSSCISLNGSSYTHAAIGGELLPACVDHRPRASNATAPAAAVISWLSRSSRTDIRRFIEYYILLGAERFAILDNLCNASAVSADEALAPYVASGHVVHLAKYRCQPWHCGLHGCTHCRRGTNTTNCGLPQHLGGASCAPLVQRTVLNHYAYQSQDAWAAKKRGNVLGRKGAVPEIYEKVRDDTGVELLSERIRLAYEARPRYGRCLGALFFGT